MFTEDLSGSCYDRRWFFRGWVFLHFFLYFVLKHRPRFFFSLEIPAFRLYYNAKYKYKSPARHFFNWTFWWETTNWFYEALKVKMYYYLLMFSELFIFIFLFISFLFIFLRYRYHDRMRGGCDRCASSDGRWTLSVPVNVWPSS